MRPLSLLPFVLLYACTTPTVPAEKKKSRTDSNVTPAAVVAAANPYADPDVSGMDVSYFPPDYPVLKMTGKTTEPPKARVIYSRPHRGGRVIFGNLLPYNQPWRLGANEATEIELFTTARIQGKTVNKGRYILYCIPTATHWQIIFNSNVFTWGLQPNPKDDVASFTVPVKATPALIEFFTIAFKPAGDGAEMILAWENVEARLPISFP